MKKTKKEIYIPASIQDFDTGTDESTLPKNVDLLEFFFLLLKRAGTKPISLRAAQDAPLRENRCINNNENNNKTLILITKHCTFIKTFLYKYCCLNLRSYMKLLGKGGRSLFTSYSHQGFSTRKHSD